MTDLLNIYNRVVEALERLGGFYNKSTMDTKLSQKSDNGHTHNYDSITGKPAAFTPSSHQHGAIQNGGTINSDTNSVNKIMVTDGSNNIKTIQKLPAANVTHQDISGKAPNDHSSTNTTYGVATTLKYGHVKVDDELKANSTNPVQNKVICEEFYTKDDIIDLINSIETVHGKLLNIYIDETTGDLIVDDDGFQYYTQDEVDENFTIDVIKQTTAESGFLSTYVIKQGGDVVGTKINIPKDFLVKSASIKTSTADNNPISGFKKGDKYIDFVINSKDGTSSNEHLYLNTNDLVDVYTADENSLVLSNNQFSIKNGGVTTDKLATNSVTTEKISNNAITNEKIVNNAISNGKLANDSVTTEKISNNAITNDKIADNTINGHEKIAPDSITSYELANNSVHTDEIADKNITQAKFTDSLSNYINGKIDKKASQILANDDLDDYKTVGFYYSYDSTRTSTLSNIPGGLNTGFSLFVYGSRMSENVENYVHQLVSAYHKDKQRFFIRTYSPAQQEWSEWIELFTQDSATINTHNLVNSSVSNEKISNYAVTNEKISSNAISNGKLANDSVTNAKIKDGNVSYRKLESHLQDTIDGKVNSIATKINSGDDLNECVRNGFYSCNSASVAKTISNYPNTSRNGFGLFVMNNSSNVLGNLNQLFVTYNNSNQNYYMRSYSSYHQSWSNWNKIITDSKYILQEKFNCVGGQTECLIEVYSDDQNVLITFKGQTGSIDPSDTYLLECNKILPEKYRPFIKQRTSDLILCDDYSDQGDLAGIIEENGRIILYSRQGVFDTMSISGSIMYPLKDRVSNNMILETNEGIGLNKSTDFIAKLSGNVENTLVEFYEEYNLGLEVDSNKYIVHDDSTTINAKLVDSNDKSRIKQEDVLVEFYEEYSISDINLNDIETTKTEETVAITAVVLDEDGSRIENETVEFFIENDTETEN